MAKSQGGLTQWFQEKWVDLSRPKKGGGFEPCGREDARGGKYPKCVPAARAARMTPEQIESAIRRKRAAESREKREGQKPIMVPTIKKVGDKKGHPFRGNQHTKAAKHAKEIDTKLRQEHGDKVADTWKPLVSEAMKTWYGQGDMQAPVKVNGKKMMVGGREINAQNVLDTMADALGDKAITRGSTFDEGIFSKAQSQNVPTDPELYARIKAEAKKKFDVYPSAYANGWLVAEYKRRGGKYKVEKYNPNHDERGRFSSAGSAKVVTVPTERKVPNLMKVLGKEGGFTYNPKRKELRQKGVAVAISKKHEKVVDEAEFKKNGEKIISDYMRTHSEALAKPNVHLGAWVDKGKVYLDLSVVKGSLSDAANIGRANDQIGIFDLSTFTTWARIEQGGKYYPQVERNMSGRKMTHLDLTDLSIGKAEKPKGVAFVSADDLLDGANLKNFVELVLSMIPISKDSPTSSDVHVDAPLGRVAVIRNVKNKKKKAQKYIEKKEPLKDPKGGLTAAGRAKFNRETGSNLKPGVRGKADTPEKMRRKGSFLTRFFTNPSGPMVKPNGEPTRLALSAAAWGEPVPKNRSDAAKLAAKGRNLLQRYENTKEK